MEKSYQIKKESALEITPVYKLNQPKKKQQAISIGRLAALGMILQTFFLATPVLAQQKSEDTLTYSQFLEKLETDQVAKVEIDKTTKRASVILKGQSENEPAKGVALFEQNQALIRQISAKNIDFSVKSSVDRSTTVGVLLNLLIILVLLLGLIMIIRRSANASGQAFSFGKSRARFQMEAKTETK